MEHVVLASGRNVIRLCTLRARGNRTGLRATSRRDGRPPRPSGSASRERTEDGTPTREQDSGRHEFSFFESIIQFIYYVLWILSRILKKY